MTVSWNTGYEIAKEQCDIYGDKFGKGLCHAWVYDFGQNVSGMLEFEAIGKAGG